MACNPKRIVEIQLVERLTHDAGDILCDDVSTVNEVPNGKKEERKVGNNRAPQKSRLGEFEPRAKFLFNGGVNHQVAGEGVQSFCNSLSKLSTGGLSVGSWLG